GMCHGSPLLYQVALVRDDMIPRNRSYNNNALHEWELTKNAAPDTPALSPNEGPTIGVSSVCLKTYCVTEPLPRSYSKSIFPTPPPITTTSGSMMLITTLSALPKNSISLSMVF